MPSLNQQPSSPLLVGDIGGTRSRLALCRVGPQALVIARRRLYRTREAASVEELIERFLAELGLAPPPLACLGIAGPVVDGAARATNLPWRVSEADLRQRFGFTRVALINDLVAQASAIPRLRPEQLLALNDIALPGRGNIGLVAAGTGLGEALLVWHQNRYHPCASEGGHKDFPPRTPLEYRLHRHLTERYGHASLERVVSGQGLVNIYTFLRSQSQEAEPPWLREQRRRRDQAAVIAEAGRNNQDPICHHALCLFVSLYGAEAGNLALQATTTGGLFLGGGIAPRLTPAFTDGAFMESFLAKGRMRSFLKHVPVRIIVDENASLLGAGAYLLDHTRSPTAAENPSSHSR